MDFEQLNLFSTDQLFTVEEVKDYLNDSATSRVSVVLTRNRVSMISVSIDPDGGVNIRMHQGFLSAPWEVIEALRRYLRRRRRADWNIVSRYARQIPVSGKTARAKAKLRSRGEVYDLDSISRSLNREFFSGRIEYRIGWSRGRTASKRRRARGRYVRFGSWSARDKLIKVHPVLDDVRVPLSFVRYIVFHEMLHAVVPQVVKNGRGYDHSPQFRKLERSFPDYGEMNSISKMIVNELI